MTVSSMSNPISRIPKSEREYSTVECLFNAIDTMERLPDTLYHDNKVRDDLNGHVKENVDKLIMIVKDSNGIGIMTTDTGMLLALRERSFFILVGTRTPPIVLDILKLAMYNNTDWSREGLYNQLIVEYFRRKNLLAYKREVMDSSKMTLRKTRQNKIIPATDGPRVPPTQVVQFSCRALTGWIHTLLSMCKIGVEHPNVTQTRQLLCIMIKFPGGRYARPDQDTLSYTRSSTVKTLLKAISCQQTEGNRIVLPYQETTLTLIMDALLFESYFLKNHAGLITGITETTDINENITNAFNETLVVPMQMKDKPNSIKQVAIQRNLEDFRFTWTKETLAPHVRAVFTKVQKYQEEFGNYVNFVKAVNKFDEENKIGLDDLKHRFGEVEDVRFPLAYDDMEGVLHAHNDRTKKRHKLSKALTQGAGKAYVRRPPLTKAQYRKAVRVATRMGVFNNDNESDWNIPNNKRKGSPQSLEKKIQTGKGPLKKRHRRFAQARKQVIEIYDSSSDDSSDEDHEDDRKPAAVEDNRKPAARK